jgi:hypothetical protein
MKLLAVIAAALFVAAPSIAFADNCYETSIVSPSPFMGNNDEIFKLADGSIWEVKYEYAYLYAYNPSVTICPSRGKLILNQTTLNVQQVSRSRSMEQNGGQAQGGNGGWDVFEETNIRGMTSGVVERGRIFKTLSGNVYEVTGVTVQVVVQVQPAVMVLKRGDTYKLVIAGFSDPLICRKLN